MTPSKRTYATLAPFSPSLSHYEPLSPEDEATATQEQLVVSNLRFAAQAALRIDCPLPLEDRIQQANLGLINAATRFDPSRGHKFITYAIWWIRQAIFEAVKEDNNIHVPHNVQIDASKARRVADKMQQASGGRAPTRDEIAKEVGVSLEFLDHVNASTQNMVSLDDDTGTRKDAWNHQKGNAMTMHAILPDGGPLPDEVLERDSNAEAVRRCVAALPERDAYVITRYFGLDDAAPENLSEIGATLGVCRERVRQLRDRAMRALRKKLEKAGVEGDIL